MGAWGVGPFENDTAADWELEMLESPTLETFERALELDEGYVGSEEGATAVAAAEMVAAALEHPGPNLPPDLRKWALEHRYELEERVDTALESLSRVESEESELRSPWKESGELEDWSASIEDCRERIITAVESLSRR